MHSTNIRAIDDLLKSSTQAIREGTDLRDDVRLAVSTLLEACHLPQTANLKLCVRTLHSRVQQCDGASLSVTVENGVRLFAFSNIAEHRSSNHHNK